MQTERFNIYNFQNLANPSAKLYSVHFTGGSTLRLQIGHHAVGPVGGEWGVTANNLASVVRKTQKAQKKAYSPGEYALTKH